MGHPLCGSCVGDHRIENPPRCGGRKIVLAEMHSIGIRGKANINAIIDDQRSPVQRHAAQLAGTAQKMPARLKLRLVAQLDERRARGDQLVRKVRGGGNWVGLPREEGEVDDGIERRQDHVSGTDSRQDGGCTKP